MRVLLVEPFLSDQEHLIFNSSVIENLLYSEDMISVKILADKAYCEKLNSVLGPKENIGYGFLFRKRQNKISTSIVLVINFFIVWFHYMRFRPHKVLFLTIEFTVFPFLFFCFYRILYDVNINFIIHQSLPLTNAKIIKRNILKRVLKFKRFNFIYLSETVFKQISKIYEIHSAQLWQHPILEDPVLKLVKKSKSYEDKFKILLFGKQFNNLSRSEMRELLILIDEFNNNTSQKIQLTIPNIIKESGWDFVNFIKGGYLSREEYLSLIHNHHYILFLSDKWVEIRASGVAMDAIKLDTIIIAPDIGFFRDLKSFCSSKYAFLFDVKLSFKDSIRSFLNEGLTDYTHYVQGCKELSINLDLYKNKIINHLV